MFANLFRIFTNTLKQIRRGGWISLASIGIMTLAFLLISVFLAMVYTSELFLQSIERSPQIYVFFNTDTEENEILAKKNEWEEYENIEFVEYTSEEDAKEEFARYNQLNDNPIIAEEIENEARTLPASLAIRLKSIDEAQEVIELVEYERDTNINVYDVRYSQETINNIRTLFIGVRIGMFVILGLIMFVILSFTLLTVEFRTYSRAKEIEIMQLVGGSLWYIRMPFILEGAIYGIIGGVLSNIILLASGYGLWNYITSDQGTREFIANLLSGLDFPTITLPLIVLIFFTPIIIGFVVGAINSLVAIIRYIK